MIPLVQDFHPFHGEQFLSSGMDNTVKIWSLSGVQGIFTHLHSTAYWAHSASNGTGNALLQGFYMLMEHVVVLASQPGACAGMQEHLESSFAHDASKGKVFHTRQLACPTFSSHKASLCAGLMCQEVAMSHAAVDLHISC